MDDINKKYKTITIKEENATILVLHYLFEKALDLIPVEKDKNKADLDLKNSLQFR